MSKAKRRWHSPNRWSRHWQSSMQLDTEELAEEERVAEPMASGPAGDAVVLPEQPVSEPAAIEDPAAESLADQSLAAVEPPDAGDQTAAAPVASGAIEAGSTPSEIETPPLPPESPAADIAELPGAASSRGVAPDDAGEVVAAAFARRAVHLPGRFGPGRFADDGFVRRGFAGRRLARHGLARRLAARTCRPRTCRPRTCRPRTCRPGLARRGFGRAAVAEAVSGLEEGSVPSEPRSRRKMPLWSHMTRRRSYLTTSGRLMQPLIIF